MAYLGKEFKFEKEENFENFIKGLPDSAGEKFLNYKPDIKLTKSGDSYTISFSSAQGTKNVTFTPGVKFHETVRDGLEADTIITVSGDTFTQVQDFGPKGTLTFTRAFSDNQLVIDMKSSSSDAVARRYYKA